MFRALLSKPKKLLARAKRQLAAKRHKRRGSGGGSGNGSSGKVKGGAVRAVAAEQRELPAALDDSLVSLDGSCIIELPSAGRQLPFLHIRAGAAGRVDLQTEKPDTLLLSCALADVPIKLRRTRGALRLDEADAYECGRALATSLSGISSLRLDASASAAEVIRGILDVFVERAAEAAADDDEKKKKEQQPPLAIRFAINELHVVDCRRESEFDALSRLLRLARRSLRSVQLRRVRLPSEEAAMFLWSSLAECQLISQVHYEPTRLDHWSRPHVVEALQGKPISSLVLTGVAGLGAADLMAVAAGNWMAELSVVGELIRPSALAVPALRPTIRSLSNLLIQIDEWFSLADRDERTALLSLLRGMRPAATLEVLHVAAGGAVAAARIISYWLELARETKRTIRLKLEGISQDRLDQAVGKLFRKIGSLSKGSWSPHFLSLSLGDGEVCVLDTHVWFGESEEKEQG